MIINGQKSTSNDMAVVVYIVQVRDPCAWLDTGCASFAWILRDPWRLWTRARARAAYRCGNSVTNSTKFKRTQKPR